MSDELDKKEADDTEMDVCISEDESTTIRGKQQLLALRSGCYSLSLVSNGSLSLYDMGDLALSIVKHLREIDNH